MNAGQLTALIAAAASLISAIGALYHSWQTRAILRRHQTSPHYTGART